MCGRLSLQVSAQQLPVSAFLLRFHGAVCWFFSAFRSLTKLCCDGSLTADPTESENLYGNPAYSTLQAKMEARLAEAGRTLAAPWAAVPELANMSNAMVSEKLCAAAATLNNLAPIDLCPPPQFCPPPPPGPTPPPSPPGPKYITKAVCDKASGILNFGGEASTACCPASCGKCGGSSCQKLPGGEKNCCTHDVETNGKPCATHTAPCCG